MPARMLTTEHYICPKLPKSLLATALPSSASAAEAGWSLCTTLALRHVKWLKMHSLLDKLVALNVPHVKVPSIATEVVRVYARL